MARSSGGSRQEQFVYKAPAKELLDSLVRRGLVPPEECAPLLEAARVTRRAVCLLILDLGHLDEAVLAEALINACNIPYVNLDGCGVDSDVLGLVPPELCWERKVLPLDLVGSTMSLAMVDPLDDMTVSRVSAERRISVCRAVAVASELTRALERHFPNFSTPAKAFGPAEAAAALKAARASLADIPVKQTKRTEKELPDWLTEKAAAIGPAAPAAAPDVLSNLPNWLDDEPEEPRKKAPKKKKGKRP